MKLTIYQIDAFANKAFEGNPAAVVPLGTWLADETMQAIAQENNLAETAFFAPTTKNGDGADFQIRWFTPTKEVRLCGHATLAAAFVLFNHLGCDSHVVRFDSLSGVLLVSKNDMYAKGELLTLNFPAQPPQVCGVPTELKNGLGALPAECLASEDYMAVFASEADVLGIMPNHEALKQLDHRGVIATAPSETYDFVVRFFAPKYGVPEDSVTGSAFTQLIPYWAHRLGKSVLTARQVSVRGGGVFCEHSGDRVLISGSCVTYMQGEIWV